MIRPFIDIIGKFPKNIDDRKKFFFDHKANCTQDIINLSNNIQNYLLNKDQNNKIYITASILLSDFNDEFCSHELIDLSDEPEWTYNLYIDTSGITLFLQKIEFCNQDILVGFATEEYILYKKEAELISSNEFALKYNVSPSTVRQWIRRGKLSSVKKLGTDWYISELSNLKSGKGMISIYTWNSFIPDFPIDGININRYSRLAIQKIKKSTDYFILLVSENEKETFKLGKEDKEKLELYLIQHPLFQSEDDLIYQGLC